MIKKAVALLISIFYLSVNSCLAVSELYYVKNIKTTQLNSVVRSAFTDVNYKLVKEDPYYGTSIKDSGDYAIVILQQSGSNIFYYYQTSGTKKINRTILRALKNSGYTYEKSENTHAISIYDQIAQDLMTSPSGNQYTFDDNPRVVYGQPQTSAQSTTLKGYVAHIDKGTTFGVYLQNPINTATAAVGDQIVAVLTSNWTYNGYVVAPQGSVVYGELTTAHGAKYASRNGRVVINFNKIVTPEGKTIEISTEKIDFSVTNEGKLASTVGSTFAGAAVGALAGLLVGLATGDIGTATAIGAGVGAGGALLGSAAEKGVDAEIPSYTEFELKLNKALRVTLTN